MKEFVLKDLPKQDRPRERLKRIGVENLSIQELLALIIEKGKRGQSVLKISQDLLAHFGSLESIKKASIQELEEVAGIGFATACKLKAVFKLGEMVDFKDLGEKIQNPKDVYNLLKHEMAVETKEKLKLLCLSSGDRLIGIKEISVGTLNSSLIHPREVFYSAIKSMAASVILVHNHPSEESSPSEDDIEVTKRIAKVGEILGIRVIDHIIIAGNKVFSFKENNLI